MSTESKTNQVQEGEISFEDLANSSFSFEVDDFQASPEDEVQLEFNEPIKEEVVETTDLDKEKKPETPKQEEELDNTKTVEPELELEKEEEIIVETKSTGDSFYKKLASRYLEQGSWEDVEVELEEGKTVKLSEITDLDEETFAEIEKAQKDFANEDIKTKYVSKEGITENGLKIIEILKNGGDITDIFEKPEDAVRPFENVDIDNERNQESILFQQYRAQGLSENESTNLVGLAKKNLTIDDKVQQIVNFHQKRYDNYLTTKVEEQAKIRAEEQTRLREFKKGVMENLKSNYKLKDTLARKLTSLGAEKNDSGEFKIDEIYAKKMEDPKEAADLLFFLNDKEAYLKMMGASTKRDTNLQTIRKVSILKDKQKTTKNETEERKSDLEFAVPQ